MGRREVSGFYSSLGRTREKKNTLPLFLYFAQRTPLPQTSPTISVCRTFRRLPTVYLCCLHGLCCREALVGRRDLVLRENRHRKGLLGGTGW